jgi:hypothetical protein
MAYQTRCPECQAKLKLEDTPASDEVLECPKCGNQFTTAAASAAARASGGGDKAAKSAVETKTKNKKKAKTGAEGKKKKKKVKKKKSNKAVMILMGLGGLAILASVIGIGYFIFGRVGKLDQIATYIPGDFNVVRGVNVGTISRYPGYIGEMDTQFGVGMKEVADQLAPAFGAEDGRSFTDIAVNARKKSGGVAGQMVIIRTRSSISPKDLASKFGAEQNMDGQTYYKATGGTGLMKNAAIFAPDSRHIVVVMAGSSQEAVLRAAVGGNKQKDQMLVSKLGATGRKIASGHLWTMVFSNGDLAKYNSDMAELVGKEAVFKDLSEQLKSGKIFGQWVTFGTKVKVGVGCECADKDAAKRVANSLYEGPLGKGDDSELPNGVKNLSSVTSPKEFKSEFLANVKYSYSGECLFAEAPVNFEKGKQIITGFNNPSLTN